MNDTPPKVHNAAQYGGYDNARRLDRLYRDWSDASNRAEAAGYDNEMLNDIAAALWTTYDAEEKAAIVIVHPPRHPAEQYGGAENARLLDRLYDRLMKADKAASDAEERAANLFDVYQKALGDLRKTAPRRVAVGNNAGLTIDPEYWHADDRSEPYMAGHDRNGY